MKTAVKQHLRATECPLIALDPQVAVAYTLALPHVPLPRHDKSGLTVSKTASTNGCPQGPASVTLNVATRVSTPKASERGSPHYESAMAGVERLKFVTGRRQRE